MGLWAAVQQSRVGVVLRTVGAGLLLLLLVQGGQAGLRGLLEHEGCAAALARQRGYEAASASAASKAAATTASSCRVIPVAAAPSRI